MKKVFYSLYTKILMSILCVVSGVCAVTFGLNCVNRWNNYETIVYSFEDNFKDSYFITSLLNVTSYDMYNAAVQYVGNHSFEVQEILDNNIDGNTMECYLIIDGKEFKNVSNINEEHDYYYKLVINKEGIQEDMKPYTGDYFVNTPEVNGHEVEIYIGLKEEYVDYCIELWLEQKELMNNTFTKVTYYILVIFLCILYLILSVGKDDKGNKKEHMIDHMYIELNVLTQFLSLGCGLYLFVVFFHQYFNGDFPFELLKLYTQVSIGFVFLLFLTLFLAIIRNIKNHCFTSRSILFIVINKIIQFVKNVGKEISHLSSNNISLFVLLGVFLYTIIIGYFGFKLWYESIYLIYGFILFVLIGYVAIRYFNSLNKIKTGVNEIRKGHLNYKIDSLVFKDLNDLKEGIHDMSSGLQTSLSNTLKAERLKTELITNVSHDLKTPLTSIINYTKLLSNIENLPEEAKDYIEIIDKKSQRLKSLTQDLFDISKVQSGNEEIILEKLNVETLLSQSLAEFEKELTNLRVCTNIEENLFINSDGRKISRVINNLLVNMIKYSLQNTRVFINAWSQDNKVFIEMKNISSYPLDFDKEEIMQRFKRGDESRSEEGHGLGLAIVKSYVEATGGKFDIILDGDMFKAIIEYDKV